MLSILGEKEGLQLYIAVSPVAVNAVLVLEVGSKPCYSDVPKLS